MIPYFQPPSWHLGPFYIQVFGLFVAAGVVLGTWIVGREAKRQRLDPQPMQNFAMWGLVLGVVFGHLVHILLYHPEELTSVWRVLEVWSGLSSFGGLLGGFLALVGYFKWKGLKFSPYGDALALGVAPGWAVARIGCFAVHDHPGILTDFFLAVRFPGGSRLDLGLVDAIWLFALTGLLFALSRKGLLRGKLLPLLALLYGVGRFVFDFMRATDLPYVDARYFGLTPAQYGCFFLVGYGLWKLLRPVPVSLPVKAEAGGAPQDRRRSP